MIEGIIVFTCGLVFGVYINVFSVLRSQSFHSKRIEELEKKIDHLLKHF